MDRKGSGMDIEDDISGRTLERQDKDQDLSKGVPHKSELALLANPVAWKRSS